MVVPRQHGFRSHVEPTPPLLGVVGLGPWDLPLVWVKSPTSYKLLPGMRPVPVPKRRQQANPGRLFLVLESLCGSPDRTFICTLIAF